MRATAPEPSKSVGGLAARAQFSLGGALACWGWAGLAVCAATLPVVWGLTGSRVFYIRDLSLYCWGRSLWLRRTLLSGESPLWNPCVARGQAAFADALHQMFLLPTLAIRLAGSEVRCLQRASSWIARRGSS